MHGKFKVGDAVVIASENPTGNPRTPGYSISEESAASLAQYMVSWRISETIVECIGLFTLSDLI